VIVPWASKSPEQTTQGLFDLLESMLNEGEPNHGAYKCEIGIFRKEVDGYFIIEMHQLQENHVIQENLWIVKKTDNVSRKIYGCAKIAGQKYASKLRCSLVDKTQRVKESKLEQEAQPKTPLFEDDYMCFRD